MNQSTMLEVSGLSKSYGKVQALVDFSLQVRAGEIVGLLGPNGAGKTTLIECILGLRQPDSGSILIDGIDNRESPFACRRITGAQLQFTELPDLISPGQALRLFGSFYRPEPDIDQLLDKFGLQEKRDAAFKTLSGGQKQRLSVALAFINNPRLLLFDEPTTGLDPSLRRDLSSVIASNRDDQCGILFATHQIEEAERICNRVAIIDQGKLVALDNPENLINQGIPVTRMIIRTREPLNETFINSISPSCIEEICGTGDKLEIRTSDSNQTLLELVNLLSRAGNEIIDLDIRKKSLEDAYFRMTGKIWGEEANESTLNQSPPQQHTKP